MNLIRVVTISDRTHRDISSRQVTRSFCFPDQITRPIPMSIHAHAAVEWLIKEKDWTEEQLACCAYIIAWEKHNTATGSFDDRITREFTPMIQSFSAYELVGTTIANNPNTGSDTPKPNPPSHLPPPPSSPPNPPKTTNHPTTSATLTPIPPQGPN